MTSPITPEPAGMAAMVEVAGIALCENALAGKRCPCRESGVFACADEFPGQQARAAIAAIHPAIFRAGEVAGLEKAAMVATCYGLGTHDFEQIIADAIRALKGGDHGQG